VSSRPDAARADFAPARNGGHVTLADLLLRPACPDPAAVALAVPGAALSWQELDARAAEMALALAALDVHPGDHVGLLLPNGLDFVVSWFGAALAGAVIVPLNTRYKAQELGYVISHAELRCLLTTDEIADHVDFPALLSEAFPDIRDAADAEHLRLAAAPELRQVINLGRGKAGWHLGREALAEKAAALSRGELERRRKRVAADDLAALVYTSGTTSRPKACMHTHESVLHNYLEAAVVFRMGPRDAVWSALPLFHGQGYGMMVAALSTGGAFLTQPYMDAEAALDLIQRYRATVLYPAFPAITARLIEHPRFAGADLSSVRALLAISPRDAWDRAQEAFAPAVQFSAYGLQEAGGAISFPSLTDPVEVRRDTCGHLLPGIEVRIVDPETGEERPPGVPGEILVRGRGQFSGYYRDPEATRNVVDMQGFIHTGDLGLIDEAGRLVYRDRIKNMLKVGGENVAPQEIETVLLTHSAVAAAAVVGIPDPRLEQVPAAFVELRPGMSATEEDLIAFCAARLARFKVPRLVRFVTEWPMSATKVQVGKLREGLLKELEAVRS
jgi:acyl-CoA synthetase (AMP-forming)/AMP-acid ligase II